MKTLPLKFALWIAVSALTLSLQVTSVSANLVSNAEFSVTGDGNVPEKWKAYGNKQKLSIDTTDKPEGAERSLKVDIVKDGGKSLGQIVQKISVSPDTNYVFKLDMKSSNPDTGLGQIKLLVGTSEIKRLRTLKSRTEWETVELKFESGEANMVWVVLRYLQRPSNIGEEVWFANPSLEEVLPD